MTVSLQELETSGFIVISREGDGAFNALLSARPHTLAAHPQMLGIVCHLLGPNISVRRVIPLPAGTLPQAIRTTPSDPYAPHLGAPMYSVGAVLCMETMHSTEEHPHIEPGDIMLIDRRSAYAATLAESMRHCRGLYLEYGFRWLAPCPTQTPLLVEEASTDIERQLFSSHGFWNTFGPQPADVPLAAWMKSNGITRQDRTNPHTSVPDTASGPRYQI